MRFIRALTVAALFAALFVLALPAQADCGDGDPACILEPPISVEIRTYSTSGDASLTASESGAITPLGFTVPMPLPRRVEAPLVSSQSELESRDSIPDFTNLSIPMRYQAAGDVSCGVQALGMALDGIDGSAPTSNSLLGFLQDQGMIYDFGTGVEELAHAAQNFGYAGSVPFHGWSLEDIKAYLAAGQPVVIDLGANGPGEPGHFVTLTGISDDWQWVAYNDPTLGERIVPLAEFMRLWGLQGRSGVAVAEAPPAPLSPDYAPWAALAATMMATLALGPSVLQDLRRRGTGGKIDTGIPTSHPRKPDERPHDPPPPRNSILVKVPHVETVVVGEKVVGGHWEEKERYIAPRWETISPGHWEWRDHQVKYTAYRSKSVLVEKVVNVVREVTEKVTTWVTKTVVKPVTRWVKKTIWNPVTKWVKRTKTWFQRTWLGKWLRKTKTWFEKKVNWVRKTVWEPVKKWVTEKVVKPVTSYVKRTIVEPVKMLVTKTIMEPYTAYRTEKVEVWTPPVKKYIPGHYETKRTWVVETIPITEQVTRWEDVYVDAGVLPDWVAQDFFQRVDPSLSYAEQMALFYRFRDALGMFPTGNTDQLYRDVLNIFFGGFTPDENGMMTASQSLSHNYGAGRDSWEFYWDEKLKPNAAQYLDLSLGELMGYGYPVHYNLCGQLAVMASLGLDLQEGLQFFAGIETSQPKFENGEQVYNENGDPVWESITGADILKEEYAGTYGWQLAAFMEEAGAGDYGFEVGSSGKPPYNADELAQAIASGNPPVALVSIDTSDDGSLGSKDESTTPAAHWVTVLGVMPTQNGEPVVRVYNPYQNREELYSWSTFEAAWGSTKGNSSQFAIVAPDEE